MPLPLYKIIEIYDHGQTGLWSKMAKAPIGSQPVVLDIAKLGPKEGEALQNIEDFLSKRKARDFPYPLYVISNATDYQGNLDIFSSLDELPNFYKKKNRPLNMKENTLLAKVGLKQKNLENINMEEIKPIVAEYGKDHKVLFKKQSYLDFISEIHSSLRGKNKEIK